jgi:kumamolisin
MVDSDRVTLAGSDRLPATDEHLGRADPDAEQSVTVYLRPKAARAPQAGAEPERLTREEMVARYGASEADVEAVRAFAAEHHLRVEGVDPARRAVTLVGRNGDLGQAFGAELGLHRDPTGTPYVSRKGPITLPRSLDQVVTGVFGLDGRPQAGTHLRVRPAVASAAGYSPAQVAQAYDYPAGTDGTGQTVALIELGGGYRDADLSAYFSSLGITAPSVTAVGVDGGTNTPGTSNGPDGEVMLDIEVAGAVAPGADIVVYFAPNTDQGFLDAVTTAVQDTTHRPSAVSISWGSAESTWTAQAMTQMEQAFTDAATLGVTVTVAAGDNGSTDGVAGTTAHVDFPASAPHALACGGTRLELSGPSVTEVVWGDGSSGDGATGGGVSDVFPLPAYQDGAGVPPSVNPGGRVGRGVPDVSGDADPATGYAVRVDGQQLVVGGTSAVAPLWAGLVVRLNQSLGRDVGDLHASLYASPGAFTDITSGSNGQYRAGQGWDACTGLGSPLGQKILAALQPAGGS